MYNREQECMIRARVDARPVPLKEPALSFFRSSKCLAVLGCACFAVLLVAFAGTASALTIFTPNYIGVYEAFGPGAPGWTWDEANHYAQTNFGTDLASVHSHQEQSEISALLAVLGVPSADFAWIGGIEDPTDSGTFEWSDGTPWDFESWGPTYPTIGGSDRVATNDSDWRDHLGSEPFVAFIANRVPEPSSGALLGFALGVVGFCSSRRSKL
jgi:hypothetical protein